jgi:crotonobetainyl-CoA:carnitine CoA-transferase CaiB-like acyl-CoA transferase
MATRPLAGVRVLDLTNVLAGPFACHQLAHLGAEVIKVEAPGRGDLARNLGADPELNAKGMGVSFLAQNAGKKSVTVNLKHARRQGFAEAAGPRRRRAGREFPARRDGPARPRLRDAEGRELRG